MESMENFDKREWEHKILAHMKRVHKQHSISKIGIHNK